MMINYIRSIYRKLFPVKFCLKGKKVWYGINCTFVSPEMIEIGNNVSIGSGATFFSISKKIIIKDNVIIAPNVTMVSGDHNIRKIGIPIIDNHEKDEQDDADIVIGEDVWIGANVTILKGVSIGRGAVIGACALIIKNIPSYSVAGGVPAKIIGQRFTKQQVIEHEKILYSDDKRIKITDLTHLT